MDEPSKRPWFQFSLRAIFILCTVVALVLFGFRVYQRHVLEVMLAQPVALAFSETPLEEVIAYLRDFTGGKVVADTRGLYEVAHISPDLRIDSNLAPNQHTLGEALDLMLAPHGPVLEDQRQQGGDHSSGSIVPIE